MTRKVPEYHGKDRIDCECGMCTGEDEYHDSLNKMTNEETTMEWKQVIETIYVIVGLLLVLMGLLIIISMVVVPAIFRDR